MSEEARKSIRVLQVIHSLGMGGAETWLMEVLRLWARSGEVQCDFLLTSGGEGIFDDEARALGAKLHYVPYGRRSLLRFAREFRRILGDGGYDAIHDHGDYASGWHYLLGGKRLPPIRVTHVHNPFFGIEENYGVSALRRMTARLGKAFVARYATHIAGTSREIIGVYGFDEQRFSRIPKAALHCGFDCSRFAGDRDEARSRIRREFGWSPDSTVILFAGRMDRSADRSHPRNHKNSAFAVDVGIQACLSNPKVQMLFAGVKTEAAPILQARVDIAALNGRIEFAGIRQDIEELMLGSDALLFPSRAEGLGMVAVEAQAAGLPVLASDSVPRECRVVESLVSFLGVDEGCNRWAEEVLSLSANPQDSVASLEAVSKSPFSVLNSAKLLGELYRTGRLKFGVPRGGRKIAESTDRT